MLLTCSISLYFTGVEVFGVFDVDIQVLADGRVVTVELDHSHISRGANELATSAVAIVVNVPSGGDRRFDVTQLYHEVLQAVCYKR